MENKRETSKEREAEVERRRVARELRHKERDEIEKRQKEEERKEEERERKGREQTRDKKEVKNIDGPKTAAAITRKGVARKAPKTPKAPKAPKATAAGGSQPDPNFMALLEPPDGYSPVILAIRFASVGDRLGDFFTSSFHPHEHTPKSSFETRPGLSVK
ncbi:UPF0329 protein ECU05_1680/ECU11_0050-like [Athalia rosae]|uniref:UPF0329 protein ECU05_1680/ECU11_0050-like n=1 Tax=Athalia rosae TaxID=37344 RepID=UPI0020341807|nr:UPF0329 protein ECU05_1680/ECU11_0050-like [Athalia rosae]